MVVDREEKDENVRDKSLSQHQFVKALGYECVLNVACMRLFYPSAQLYQHIRSMSVGIRNRVGSGSPDIRMVLRKAGLKCAALSPSTNPTFCVLMMMMAKC